MKKPITKLTKKQLAKIPEYVENWTKFGLSTKQKTQRMNVQDEINKQFDWELQTKPYRRMEVQLNKDIDEQINNISLVRHRFSPTIYHNSTVYGQIEDTLRKNIHE